MSAEDLFKPLGAKQIAQSPLFASALKKLPLVLASVGVSLVSFYVLWTMFYTDPIGGEPKLEVALQQSTASSATSSASDNNTPNQGTKIRNSAAEIENDSGVIVVRPGGASAPQSVVIKAPQNTSTEIRLLDAPNERLSENSKVGILPKISEDGLKPLEGYARPLVSNITGKKTVGKIAIVISGLGINSSGTLQTIAKLPGTITFAFAPYGSDNANLVKRAREDGHEVLLQIPMEPFDFPNNDPGPQSLLTTLDAKANMERLHWLMSRFSGYVGIMNYMGAKFSSEQNALTPILRETTLRGLLYFDDGSSARSLSEKIGTEQGASVLKAKIILDAQPKPEAISKALLQLENEAKENGFAIGTASALPISIDEIARWASSAPSRGFEIVPISAIALTQVK